MSKAHPTDGKTFRAERNIEMVGEQLIRAFPLPTSGSFGDLLSAIDKEYKVRRT